MALKKIRFLWDTPPLPDGRWRLGLLHLQQTPDPARPLPPCGVPAYWKGYLHHTLNLSVRGLLVWGAGAAVCAWCAAAGALYLRHERANPHNRVGYLDLLLPTRWDDRERLQGEGFILLARDKLAAGRFGDGFGLLRLGLEKNPSDSDARLDLARIYVAMRLRPQAEKILRAGLAFGHPGRAYLETVFTLAADGDQPAAWVELCELARARLDELPETHLPTGDSLWLDQQTAKALVADARPREASALVASRYPEAHPFRREITVLDLLDTKNTAAAIALATTWAEEQPRAPEPLRLLVRAHREADDFAGMDTALARLRALQPTKPEALLYALVQNQLAGRHAEALAAKDELFFRHGANEALYPALAAVLVETGLESELPALMREMTGRGFSPRPVLIPLLQARITARDWPAALATAGTIRTTPGRPLTATQQTWLESMTRLATACADAGSGNQSALVETIADHPGTLRLYLLAIEALLDSGRVDTAAQILALAEGPYPSARSIVALRTRIETQRAALAAAAPVAPPTAAAQSTTDALADLASFEAAFATRIQETDTACALALLSAARRAQPAWLSVSEHRLDALELPVRARSDDPLRLQLLARQTLARGGDAPARLLDLARSLHAEGHRSNAVLLVKEILRREPDHADALAQLAAWTPHTDQRPLDIQP